MIAGMESQDNRIKKKVFSGMIWAFGEQFSAQAISFVLSVILARLLMPEEYGTITMVLVFINGAFIGGHSIILKGSHIGENSVIGAGSVVAGNIPANEIWAGNPARFIKKIKDVMY